MIFSETPLQGAFVVDLQEISDDRGFFARAFCAEEFEQHGLIPAVAQVNLSFNEKKGTIRGLHYQNAPASEAKFMRCISGAIYDVIVDLRPGSPTYRQHFGIELSARNRRALYVPEMFAHGYLALTDGAQAFYSASEFYTPGVEGGIRYDDPVLGIQWPIPVSIVSEKDASWPLLDT
ncbi:dTDP-4-dehydrorhamnose 3,5-epimerase [Ruegeria sp. THAF57]|uniref:dTDP-4-dehydrorhamnose 3,5-epimerase n=1 Tax=Ruegeria sp. THAF57 TaxID=2744555 RepID=UPI0015DD9057|nr:dTDP-4-dehydrorhamnose 3,5-epimerase [Ruegeria sp. THAF57]CAD0184412.1 dTDP-4-dehydrorhamnose 3,5-epimerase [Ruegeria sp. THAF57]